MLKQLQNVHVWEDIYKVTKKQTNKDKGDLFENITYYIFKLMPRFIRGVNLILDNFLKDHIIYLIYNKK